MAADRGCSIAQYNLGICYKNGKDVTKDDKEAVKYFKMAADQGYSIAQLSWDLL